MFREMRAHGQACRRQPLRESHRTLEQSQAGAARAVRRDGGPGRGRLRLARLHESVPDADAEGRRRDVEPAGRRRAGRGDAVLHACAARSPIASAASRRSSIGCLIAALTFFPIFHGLTHYANPAIEAAQAHSIRSSSSPIRANAASSSIRSAARCSRARATSPRPRSRVMRVPYSNEAAPAGTLALVQVGDATVAAFDGAALTRRRVQGAQRGISRASWQALLKRCRLSGERRSAADQLRDGVPAAVRAVACSA